MKIFLLPALALLAATQAQAQTLFLQPTAKGGIHGPRPTTMTTLAPEFKTGAQRIPESYTGYRFWCWAAEFDLSALPSGAVVETATFAAQRTTTGNVPEQRLFGYTGDGMITGGDGNGGGLSPLVQFASDVRGDALDVTGLVQSLQANRSRYAGFRVAGSSGLVDWNGTPTLTVAYRTAPVPEPGTMVALGVGALTVLRRRKRQG